MWTINEAAEALEICKEEICKAVARGHLEYVIIDSQITLYPEEVKKWLEKYCDKK